VFRLIVKEAAAAGEEGAFDASRAHLDRMLIDLDDRGWEELSEVLIDVMRRAQEIQARSDARRAPGDRVSTSELAIMHFALARSARAQGRVVRSPPLPAPPKSSE
jgi:hypothetical protein